MVATAWKEVFHGWKRLLLRLTLLLLGASTLGSMIISIKVLHDLEFPISIADCSLFLAFNLAAVIGLLFPILVMLYTGVAFRNFIYVRGLDNLSVLGVPHRCLLSIPIFIGGLCALIAFGCVNFFTPWSSRAAQANIQQIQPKIPAQSLTRVGSASVWFDSYADGVYHNFHYLRDTEYIFAKQATFKEELILREGRVVDVGGDWDVEFTDGQLDLRFNSIRESVNQMDSIELYKNISKRFDGDRQFYEQEFYKRISLPFSLPALFIIVFAFIRNNRHPALATFITIFLWWSLIRLLDGVAFHPFALAFIPFVAAYLFAVVSLCFWKEL